MSQPQPHDDGVAISGSLRQPALFKEVFDRHYPSIRRYLARRVGGDCADDLAAETFTIAFERRAGYDASRADARPWLLGIAANLMRRARRQEVRALRAYARSGVDPLGIDESDRADARVSSDLAEPGIAAALARLSAGDREALLLFAWADLTYEEVGLALNIPVGTVRSRISRARARMTDAFKSEPTPLVTTLKGGSL